jgi:4-oxalocrotonate tautomerase
MPLIEVKMIEQTFTTSEKSELISKLTDALVSVKGEYMREVTWIIIEDIPSGQWGIRGKAATTEDARAFAAAKNQ